MSETIGGHWSEREKGGFKYRTSCVVFCPKDLKLTLENFRERGGVVENKVSC